MARNGRSVMASGRSGAEARPPPHAAESNLSTWDRNVLDGLKWPARQDTTTPELTYDEACAMYLRWAHRDKRNPGGRLKAERVAREWCELIAPTLSLILPVAANELAGNEHAVLSADAAISAARTFIRERFENMHFSNPGTDDHSKSGAATVSIIRR